MEISNFCTGELLSKAWKHESLLILKIYFIKWSILELSDNPFFVSDLRTHTNEISIGILSNITDVVEIDTVNVTSPSYLLNAITCQQNSDSSFNEILLECVCLAELFTIITFAKRGGTSIFQYVAVLFGKHILLISSSIAFAETEPYPLKKANKMVQNKY